MRQLQSLEPSTGGHAKGQSPTENHPIASSTEGLDSVRGAR
jgi:hypothetical protein